MNLPVPDPILLTNSHDGLDGVRLLSWLSSLLLIIKTAWPVLCWIRIFLVNNSLPKAFRNWSPDLGKSAAG